MKFSRGGGIMTEQIITKETRNGGCSGRRIIHSCGETTTKKTTITPNGEEKDDRELFSSYFIESKLPPPKNWPNQEPIYVNASIRGRDIQYDLPLRHDGCSPSIPLHGEPIRFDGPLFQGCIVSRVKGLDKNQTTNYFQNRSRQFQWIVQGQFTKRTRFDQILTGQDFGRPFRNAPAGPLVKRVISLLQHRLPDTFECDLFCEEPRFEHPLIAGCQNFRVDHPYSLQKVVIGLDDRGGIIEDTSLLNNDSVPKEPELRRKFFAKQENLENFYFEPHFLYTFEFYANFFSPSKHRLEITPFFSLDLTPYFNGYPLFMAMAKDQSTGDYLWATEMWHKQLLEYDLKSGFMSRFFGSSSKQTKKSSH